MSNITRVDGQMQLQVNGASSKEPKAMDFPKFPELLNRYTKVVQTKIVACLDYDEQECLRLTGSLANKVVKAHQRLAIPQLFDPFIKDLYPGGAEMFNQLPIQIVRQREKVTGSAFNKPVILEVTDLYKVNNKLPDAVIGMEVNEADVWVRTSKQGNITRHQPFRPFLAIPVRKFHECRIPYLPSLTHQMDVHVIFREVSGSEHRSSWGAYGSIPTMCVHKYDGSKYESSYVTGFIASDTDCFLLAKQILAGEVLNTHSRVRPTCGCCSPYCRPRTPCAPFQILLFDSTVKMGKAGKSVVLAPASVKKEASDQKEKKKTE